MGLGKINNPGPGFMPFVSGGILCLLGVTVLLILESKKSEQIQGWERESWGKISITLIAIISYAMVLQRLGFLLSTFFVMVVYFRLFGVKKWIIVLFGSILTTFVAYSIFEIWLQCGFPKGILGA